MDHIIGLTCRYVGGQKKAWPGGKRGLAIPSKWRDRPDAIFLPEGSSDVLALTALGLAAVGRPSCMGGVDLLAELLRDIPADRQIIVLGEMDPKPNGQWPGMDGARNTAEALAAKLSRPVQWALPPDKTKDVRQWVLDHKPDPTCADEWSDLGEKFLARLKPVDAVSSNRANAEGAVSSLVCFADVPPERVDWLWPGFIPLGKLTILDGDPGLGKSTVTLELAARVSTGREMPDGSPGKKGGVVLLNAEDGPADTIAPRLAAAGADRSRIFALSTITDAQGERLPSLPADAEAIRNAAKQADAILIVVDPLMAYLGGEVNSHRDQDCRRALWPLVKLAEETGVAVLVVRHLNKGGRETRFTAAEEASASSGRPVRGCWLGKILMTMIAACSP